MAAIFGGVSAALGQTPAVTPNGLHAQVQPIFHEFCFGCHNPEKQKGDVNLVALLDSGQTGENRQVWEKVVELLDSGEMPPEKKPQPTDAQRQTVLHLIQGELAKSDCHIAPNPGRVTLRRLNRAEYRNTIRDLLHVDFSTEDFPSDEVGYGFDNIGDVLSLSPMLMEKFINAAEEIAHQAIVVNPAPHPFVKRLRGEEFKPTSAGTNVEEKGSLAFATNAEAQAALSVVKAGTYRFRVAAHGDLAGPELPRVALRIDGRDVKIFNLSNPDGSKIYEASADLPLGEHRISLAFLNDYYEPATKDPALHGDRNAHIESVEILGPQLDAAESLPESHRALITRMPAPGEEHACAREVISRFLPRAFRRPVTAAEIDRVTGFVDVALKNGGSYLEGVQLAVQAALCSSQFLFRCELDPAGSPANQIRVLSDYEIAARLSYFLWSSMPDSALFAAATRGELHQPAQLEIQVARMLRDPKARALVTNFAAQWLQIRNMSEVNIDPGTFPNWDDSLKAAMREESERFFQALLTEDRPVTDLLEANYTFLNEKLARFYGIEGVTGDEFRRVNLPPDSPRGGVLGQAAVLLATSTPTRTSPVIRGKWVLEQILGTPPPPPPPSVPPLAERHEGAQNVSLRQRLEQHRSRAECASCHARMDPLGFALENFDATGAWRDREGDFPIDASGKLPNGTTFQGPRELKRILRKDPRFIRNLTQKLLTYALGRGLEYYDRCAADAVVARLAGHEQRFSALITGIVLSDPFLKRRHEIASN